MPEPRVDSKLNALPELERVSREHWPEHSKLRGHARAKALARLRLAHVPAPRITDQRCPRCQGESFGVYSARRGSLQCVRCRQVICPRAGSVAELASALAQLRRASDPTPPRAGLGSLPIRCQATCKLAADGSCQRSEGIALDASAVCQSREPDSKPPDSKPEESLHNDD